MRKLKILLWGLWNLLVLRLTKRKVLTNNEIIKKSFNFVGASKRPHKGMSLFSYDQQTGKVDEVVIIRNDNGSNGFINPDHKHVWALNKKSAIKKISKDESITIQV